MILGVSRDITDQHYANIAIEERNFELEQINTELQSFNHVASHDLQEPLRKIQTFATRILEKEESNLSENGKNNFNRILFSAQAVMLLFATNF